MMRWCLTGRNGGLRYANPPYGLDQQARLFQPVQARDQQQDSRRPSTPQEHRQVATHVEQQIQAPSRGTGLAITSRQQRSIHPAIHKFIFLSARGAAIRKGACARPDQQFRDTYPEMRWLSGCGTMRMVASLRWGRRTYPAWKIRSI
jgi:hypothetical protein